MVSEAYNQLEDDFPTCNIKDAPVFLAVPERYDMSQRGGMGEAMTISGMNATHIISEPTAAAVAWQFRNPGLVGAEMRLVMVVDVGGGTTDVSLLSMYRDNAVNPPKLHAKVGAASCWGAPDQTVLRCLANRPSC